MAPDLPTTYPGERPTILAEERREWRAGLGALALIGGAAVASWLMLSSPQDVSEFADSVVPAADAATLFHEQRTPFDLRNGARPVELAEQTGPAPQADAPLTDGDIIDLQTRLKALGFDPGKVDGKAGARTLNALNAYRASLGLQATTVIDRQAAAPLTP